MIFGGVQLVKMAKKSKLKRAIVFPDVHFPLHDTKALSCALQAIKIVKPEIYVNIGDVGEWHHFSPWKYKGKKLPDLEYQIPFLDQDIRDVNAGLDMIAALSAETNFLASNGEARRALKENSVAVNKDKVGEDYTITTEDLINDKYIVINRGKKKTFIIKVV